MTRFVLIAAAALAFAGTAGAQEVIGKADAVKPDASGTVVGTLSANSGVHSNETIGTGEAGRADLSFHDSSKLAVGPRSSVKLDRFVYDKNRGAGALAIDAARGAFRFSSGPGTKATVKTPYGSLGVRG